MTQPTARRSAQTKATILRAAKERFAADGYDRATIRAIAADAGIDPSMVMRYYGNKERLFAEAAELDLRIPDLTVVPRHEVGARLVAHFLDLWSGVDGEVLVILLRAAATNDDAVAKAQQIFAGQVGPVVATLCAVPAEAPTRTGLIATQLIGLALCRFVLRLPPVVAMDRGAVITWLGPTIQRYLDESDVR